MIPGPKIVYKCPNCGNLLKNSSLMSGNTFGTIIFSDGKRVAPMLPKFPNLTKCKKCNTFLWLSKLGKIGSYRKRDETKPEWENADNVEFLEINDYFDMLKLGVFDNKSEENKIRREIWWAYNDRRRDGKEMFVDENDKLKWQENCLKLIDLLDFSDMNQRIMIAEINRNLGNFEKAIEIISSVKNNKFDWLKEKLLAACKEKNMQVIVLG
jgi:hypothetical protein